MLERKQVSGMTLLDVIPLVASGERTAAQKYTRQILLRAFVDVCLAVEFAHTRGVVHRDLKPANILLGDFGEVYVLDWGIARVADQTGDVRESFAEIETVSDGQAFDGQTQADAILGTPGYIAPEQIASSPTLDGRADVYSLGCILFELLALQPLHPRGHAAIASALSTIDSRPSVRAPNLDIPPELDAICVRATAVDPERRYHTARELGEAVAGFLDGTRDNTLRGTLARTELDTAIRELASGSSQGRRHAMRGAARALALDPTYRHAADLVGHLMLEPPKEMPAEVQAELEQHDVEQVQKSARFGSIAAAAYPIFWIILYLDGFRDLWYLITAPLLSLLIIFTNQILIPRWIYWHYLAIAGNLAVFALFAFAVSPVVFGPGPPIVMITLLASQRRLMPLWLAALFVALVTISPWLLELAGVIGPVISVQGSDLVLHTMSHKLDLTVTLFGLIFYTLALAQLAALLARMHDDDRLRARRTMQLQTWQLRQLVPRAETIPPR